MTPQIEQHLSANGNMTRKQIMINNFLGGLSWGFGTVVGATIVAALLISFLRFFNFIPGLSTITDQFNQTKTIRQR